MQGEFTFQYGSIQMEAVLMIQDPWHSFTFQYGSIQMDDRPIFPKIFMMNLHSNMVLFKSNGGILNSPTILFTFQYGSIQIANLRQKIARGTHLHSNMVLFKCDIPHYTINNIQNSTFCLLPIFSYDLYLFFSSIYLNP